jgi:transmembrane sensor
VRSNSEHIDFLISRYLSGEATYDEVAELESWMFASKENKKYFEGIKFIHEKTIAYHRRLSFDVDAGWNKLHRNMQNPNRQTLPTSRTLNLNTKYFLGIAASIAIIVGLSIWYFQFSKNPRNEIAYVSKEKVENIILKDSSKIILNRKSEIKYSSGFGIKNREVTLAGEAYFDVVHNTKIPFVVKTQGTIVEDIGTAFNIKSITDSAFIEVFVDSGSVRFYTSDNPGIRLKKGETAIYNKKTNTFTMIHSIDENKLSYETHKFKFDNTRLADALTKISDVYQVSMKISNPKTNDCQITVVFENESIDAITNIIAETLGLKVIKNDGGYIFEGKGCE